MPCNDDHSAARLRQPALLRLTSRDPYDRQVLIITLPHGKFNWRHQRWGWHITKCIFWHLHHISHYGDAATWPDINRGAARNSPEPAPVLLRGLTARIFRNPGPQRPTSAPHERHRCQGWFTIFNPCNRWAKPVRHFHLNRAERCIQFVIGKLFTRGRHHQQ